MNQQLIDQTYENYQIISSQKEMSVEQFIQRSIEGSNSQSCRTMIRDAIQNYYDGIMSFNDLSIFTQSKYEDGFNALTNATSASRVVDGMIVAEVNESLASDVLSLVVNVNETQFDLLINDQGDVFARIISPIKNGELVIGHDVVTFDMTPLIKELNDDVTVVTIINNELRFSLLENAKIITQHEKYVLLLKDKRVIFISDIIFSSSDSSVSIETSQELLEDDINSLTMRSLLWSGFLVIISLGFVIMISIKGASNRLSDEKNRRMYFQDKANKDALTGLYSRHFLEYAKSNLIYNMMPVSIVMSDVNGFKRFNDTYGHVAGDQALIDLATIFKNIIRDDDLAVRYGGDEFLFIFKYCDEALCESIMKRINNKIEEDFKEKNISLAYGYIIVDDPNLLDISIEKADKIMYQNKRKII
ncbi:MAG: GGDEF domain-containing protein [Tenericutes bacterium]|nr:GGDEF domain-containing protein [Mycoplasmatota bacterium]